MSTETTPQPRFDTSELAAPQAAAPASHQAAVDPKRTARIPINLDNWRALPEDQQASLLWFHQHIIDQRLTYEDAGELINANSATITRVLRGIYEGSYENICKRIESFRRINSERVEIKSAEWVETRTTKMIWAGLTYALSNNSICVIQGESRMGKTCSAMAWRDANNHGRTVYLTAPVSSALGSITIALAEALGINPRKTLDITRAAIYKAFSRNRMLVVDEAHRLIPNGKHIAPVSVEFLRDIHDRTGCGLAFISTARFGDALQSGEYQWEQLIGRIGMPVRLYRRATAEDVLPIISQYLPNPDEATMTLALEIANKPGRLGMLTETLRVASKISAKRKVAMTPEHFKAALRLREEMAGEVKYAAR